MVLTEVFRLVIRCSNSTLVVGIISSQARKRHGKVLKPVQAKKLEITNCDVELGELVNTRKYDWTT